MIRKRWKGLTGIALVFSLQGAFAGEAWLVITSDQPGAMVSVDNAYRGVTPQRPSDALHIQVSLGTRKIHAHKQIAGKEYAARVTMKAIGGKENLLQLNLREEATRASTTPTTLPSKSASRDLEQ
ncbi:MAG: hypothetical protein F9K25_10470 [Candidatus Contendobacter sp.]|nr:MAG: hypothetical protein F9K25_10470 [Candidatus Contendobacter sp.]